MTETIHERVDTGATDLQFDPDPLQRRDSLSDPLSDPLVDPLTQPLQFDEPEGEPEPEDEPDPLGPVLEAVEAFGDDSKVRGSKRSKDKDLVAIDRWCEAVLSSEGEQQEDNLRELADAVEHWLGTNAGIVKGTRGKRRQAVLRLLTALQVAELVDPDVYEPVDDFEPEPENIEVESTTDEVDETLIEALDISGGTSGMTGDLSDLHSHTLGKLTDPQIEDLDPMEGKGGGGTLNNEFADLGEGSNVLSGVLGMRLALRRFKSEESTGWDKVESIGDLGSGLGKTTHGVTKTVKGGGLLHGGGKNAKEWTQVGDSGASVADGLGFVANLISTLRSGKELGESGQTTGQEVEALTEFTSNLTHTGESGTRTALDIVKSVSKCGETELMSELATGVGALGVVAGSIEIISGTVKLLRARHTDRSLDDLEELQQRVVDDVNQAMEELDELDLWELPYEESRELRHKLIELESLMEELQRFQEMLEPAFDGLRQLSNRRMSEGKMKMAKGVLAVTGGALLLSGVGAPVALTLAAIGGVLALGGATVKWRRNKAGNRLTRLAQRLDEDGDPQGTPDEEMDYREMERRVRSAYFEHLSKVMTGGAPEGMDGGDFSDVKNFVWEDKLKQVDKSEVRSVEEPQQADWQPRSAREEAWWQTEDEQYKERPSGSRRVKLKLTPSGHKSKQAREATAFEVAEAIYKLAAPNYDPVEKTFVTVDISVLDDLDEQGEDMDTGEVFEQFKTATMHGLLAAAGITTTRWDGWWRKAGGGLNEAGDDVKRPAQGDKLFELVKKHVSK